jgi:hypothetical protein
MEANESDTVDISKLNKASLCQLVMALFAFHPANKDHVQGLLSASTMNMFCEDDAEASIDSDQQYPDVDKQHQEVDAEVDPEGSIDSFDHQQYPAVILGAEEPDEEETKR